MLLCHKLSLTSVLSHPMPFACPPSTTIFPYCCNDWLTIPEQTQCCPCRCSNGLLYRNKMLTINIIVERDANLQKLSHNILCLVQEQHMHITRNECKKWWICAADKHQSVIMWLLSDRTAIGAPTALAPVADIPPKLSSRMPPANTGCLLSVGASDESTIIWFDSDSVFAGGATFSLLPSPISASAQSILKRVTLGHVARMLRCSYHTTTMQVCVCKCTFKHHYNRIRLQKFANVVFHNFV